jgi:hypothetical protein
MKNLFLSAALLTISATLSFGQTKTAPQTTPATTTTTAAKSGAIMTFTNDVFEFGTITQGAKVQHTFEFTNTGTEPLIITEAHGSCGCTVPEWPKEPIAKGKKGKIQVTFNSEGKLNVQDKTITINSNAANSPVILHVKGNIVAPAVTDEAKPTEAPKQ